MNGYIEQLLAVGDRVQRQGGAHQMLVSRSLWMAGALRACPTTTRRPSEASQHLDRRPVEAAQRLAP